MANVMAFIDGENLTTRYEEMLKSRQPRLSGAGEWQVREAVTHIPGKFAWSRHSIRDFAVGDNLSRAYYYTTFVGAHEELDAFSAQVGACAAEATVKISAGNLPEVRLIPRVFKKTQKGTKTKSVDISLCVDVLELVKNNALDAVYLISGDVDYRPLIEAVMRAGKRVYVASLSSGRSDVLPNLPDVFVDLDRIYFK